MSADSGGYRLAVRLPTQTTKKAPDESGAFFILCARGDLNPHAR